MARAMHDIITEQMSELTKQGYSLTRAANVLKTIDRAGGGRNVQEIERVKKQLAELRKNPKHIVEEHFVVEGLIKGKRPVYYTGRAGEHFIDKSILNAFTYDTMTEASVRASNLNRVSGPMLGIEFRVIPVHNKRLAHNPKRKTKKRPSRSRYKHEDINAPSKMAKGSIRTVSQRGGVKVRVGCPKGKYNRKTGRCKVGTRAVSVLIPNPKGRTFRVFVKRREKKHGQMRDVFYYYTGDSFDTNFAIAAKMGKEAAIRQMRRFHNKFPQYTFGVSDGKA